jgi:predicted deacylase
MLQDMNIEKQVIKPGESGIVKINVGRLPSDTKITIQAHVFRSMVEGPTALILSGVHGDEINGVEIVRSFLSQTDFDKISKGNIIVIPLLNIYGFINFNRYVPDGKDVNRSFPGTLSGSLASRIARTLTKYVLPHVDYIFDFHTGGDSRFNYPQIRYSKIDEAALDLAYIFSPGYIIQSRLISKSLRKTARDLQITTLVFEGGESVRLNGHVIETGLTGLKNCLEHLEILPKSNEAALDARSILIVKTSWIRASQSGIFIWLKSSGETIKKGDLLGHIHDPYGQKSVGVVSNSTGHIIGHNNASVVNQGDALFHIGYEND